MILSLLDLQFSYFILRIFLGIFFIMHGYPKLFTHLRHTAEFLRSLHFRFAHALALFIGAIEFFGGILLVMGMWTQIISALFVVILLVALLRVKLGNQDFIGGWELDFLAFGMALALLFGLPGGSALHSPF